MAEAGRYEMIKTLVEQYGLNLYHEAISIASNRDDSEDFLAWAMLDLEKKRYRCGCSSLFIFSCGDKMALDQAFSPGDATNMFRHIGHHDIHLTCMPSLLDLCPKTTHPKRHAWLSNYNRTRHFN